MNLESANDSGRPVAVVTDSTTYLPAELIERMSIRTVSLYVGWEGELRREDEYDDLDAFYTRLRDSPSAADDVPALGR